MAEVSIASMSLKLIHEKSDPIRAAIDFAVQSNEGINENILAAQLNGMNRRAKRMINLAEEGKYYPGLPDVTFGEYNSGIETPRATNPEGITPYPIVVLRENQVFIGGNDIENPVKDNKYLETKRIMKKLNIRLTDLYEALEGPEDNPNEDLDKLDDTFFGFCTDIYSSLESTHQYHWNFFDYLESNGHGDAIPEGEFGAVKNYVAWREYQETENIFSVRFTYDEITRETVNNSFLKAYQTPEEIAAGVHPKPVDFKTTLYEGDAGALPDPLPATITVEKQVSYGVVEKLTVIGPYHAVTIDAKGDIKTVFKGIDPDFFHLPPESEEAGTSGFYLPMIKEIVEVATGKHEQIALYDGAMMAMFVAEEIDLAWYQTGWFKVIMTIVAIVVQFIPGVGQFASVTIQNIMLAVLKTVILGFIFSLLIQALVQELGIFGAVIAIAASIYLGGGLKLEGLPFATELLKATAVLGKAVVINESVELRDEMEEFEKDYEEKKEELRAANELLSSGGLDPTLLVEAYASNPYEEPEDFYTRTIHTSNPGVLSLDAIEQYIANKLVLPEFRPDLLESGDGKAPFNENQAQFQA